MKEYIERGELESILHNRYDKLAGLRPDFYAGYMMAFHTIEDDVPTAADVVEVVRCKDCKYCIPAIADNAEYELCIVDNDVFPVSVQKQHFCSRGKRKEE